MDSRGYTGEQAIVPLFGGHGARIKAHEETPNTGLTMMKLPF